LKGKEGYQTRESATRERSAWIRGLRQPPPPVPSVSILQFALLQRPERARHRLTDTDTHSRAKPLETDGLTDSHSHSLSLSLSHTHAHTCTHMHTHAHTPAKRKRGVLHHRPALEIPNTYSPAHPALRVCVCGKRVIGRIGQRLVGSRERVREQVWG
jgi:hypothetical protein